MSSVDARPVDVLVVSNLYPPLKIGGYEIAAADIVEGLCESGIRVHVLTSNYKVNEVIEEEPGVSRILELSNDWFAPKGTPDDTEKIRRNYKTMQKVLLQYRPRVVYVWNICFLGDGVVVVPCEQNIPVVHHVMGYDLLSYRSALSGIRLLISRLFMKSIQQRRGKGNLGANHLSNIIFISRYMQSYYKRLGVNPHVSEVVYPGILCGQVSVRTEYPALLDSVNIVYSGQIVKHKGVLELRAAVEKAAIQLPNHRLHLTLYGDGPAEMIERMLAPASFQISHKGFVERTQLYQELYTQHIGVFTSLWDEPFGIAQVELMAAGLPILSSAKGGSSEAVCDGKTAMIYNATDPEQLAVRMIHLIQNYSTMGRDLGMATAEVTHRRFSRKISLEGVRNVLDRVIRDFRK